MGTCAYTWYFWGERDKVILRKWRNSVRWTDEISTPIFSWKIITSATSTSGSGRNLLSKPSWGRSLVHARIASKWTGNDSARKILHSGSRDHMIYPAICRSKVAAMHTVRKSSSWVSQVRRPIEIGASEQQIYGGSDSQVNFQGNCFKLFFEPHSVWGPDGRSLVGRFVIFYKHSSVLV
jgi:hypothetical protein